MSRSRVFVGLSSIAVVLAACGTPKPPVTPEVVAPDPAALAATRDRQRTWESGALPKQRAESPNKNMSFEAESSTQPKVECSQESGHEVCSFEVHVGKSDSGTDRQIDCATVWHNEPLQLGAFIHKVLGKCVLDESPELTVRKSADDSLAARFKANCSHDEDGTRYFGTAKVAINYRPGMTTICGDIGPGAIKTFDRITSQIFDSTKTRTPEDFLYQSSSRGRRGDTVNAFSYSYVHKTEDGFAEHHTHFYLHDEEKSWNTFETSLSIERSTDGDVETYARQYVKNGDTLASLSAKPSENGRFRLKAERSGHSDSLEITPQAPLSSETWEAPSLRRVANSSNASHRYSFVELSDDGDPTLGYSKLTRGGENVVLEEFESSGKRKKTDEPKEKNEITVDAGGFSIKQVSAHSVTERLGSTGALPPASAKSKPNATVKASPKAAAPAKATKKAGR